MLKKFYLSLLIEFGPIIVFLFVSRIYSFDTSVLIFVVATIAALLFNIIKNKKIAWFPLIVACSVILPGLLTYFLHDPFFIIFKDTIYNFVFGTVLLTGVYTKKSLLKPLFESLFDMSDRGWHILTFRWGCMFMILALGNEVARAFFDPNQWIMYKGSATVVTILFSLYQFTLSRKHRLPHASAWGVKIT